MPPSLQPCKQFLKIPHCSLHPQNANLNSCCTALVTSVTFSLRFSSVAIFHSLHVLNMAFQSHVAAARPPATRRCTRRRCQWVKDLRMTCTKREQDSTQQLQSWAKLTSTNEVGASQLAEACRIHSSPPSSWYQRTVYPTDLHNTYFNTMTVCTYSVATAAGNYVHTYTYTYVCIRMYIHKYT